MEFLKSCQTNVYEFDGVTKIKYQILQSSEEDSWVKARVATAKLREQGDLCAVSGGHVVTFLIPGRGGEETEDISAQNLAKLRDLGYHPIETRSLGESPTAITPDGLLIKDLLCTAIEAAISSKLSCGCTFLRCGPGSWLFRTNEDQDTYMSIRLGLHFTKDDTLFATSEVERSPFTAVASSKTLSSVGLAPFGTPAKLLDYEKDLNDNDESHKAWKQTVIHTLQAEDIAISETEPWTIVHPVDAEPYQYILWPSRLVLFHVQRQEGSNKKHTWRAWFNRNVDDPAYKNPLALAEQWFTSNDERENVVANREAQMSVIAAEKAIEANVATDMENDNVVSPAAIQRMFEQQTTTSGIYPTPPDGLAPVGQAQPIGMEGMLPLGSSEAMDSMADYLPDAASGRADSVNSLDGPPGVASNGSDLFGEDMGGMDFTGGEVDDADFSFFDEPDDLPMNESVAEPIGHISDSVSGRNVQPVESGVQDPNFEDIDHPPLLDAEMLDTSTINESPGVRPDADDNDVAASASNEFTALREGARTKAEKPLSPFGVRERLLPPPIPASAAHTVFDRASVDTRRSSTFGPVLFREGLPNISKYDTPVYEHRQLASGLPAYDISLPNKTKNERRLVDKTISELDPMNDSTSEDESDDGSTTTDEQTRGDPATDSRKRKRGDDHADGAYHVHAPLMLPEQRQPADHVESTNLRLLDLEDGLQYLADDDDAFEPLAIEDNVSDSDGDLEHATRVDGLFDLDKLDLAYVAQLTTEQSVSCLPQIVQELYEACDMTTFDMLGCGTAVQAVLELNFQQIMTGASSCTIEDLAIAREPPGRPLAQASASRAGQPRPLPRGDSGSLGPDVLGLPVPYVRASRGPDTYELLFPAIHFWETLSLGPTNGAKDIRAFCVYPQNQDLYHQILGFLSDLSVIYESCKLGSHVYPRKKDEKNQQDRYQDGLAAVEIGEDTSIDGALRAYRTACRALGSFLSSINHDEPERTFVVYLIDVFESPGSRQFLSAAFWALWKAYRAKTSTSKTGQPCSDVVLQIVPVRLVASLNALVMMEAPQYAKLAREVYDRCPPSLQNHIEQNSPLPNFAAPSVELASAPPKRIGFQLSFEPPSDLLHEGSTLHVAYALSSDTKWLSVSWVDSTGRYFNTSTISLVWRSFAAIVEIIWERTRDIMQAREVFWRVYILAEEGLDPAAAEAWRRAIETPRKQPYSVTLLSAQTSPLLRLRPRMSVADESHALNNGAGAGFLTPATTPQASGSLTVSPDTSGPSNVPPTPAPSDSITHIVEQDPDAHLVDLREEAWAVVLLPAFAAVQSPSTAFVSGTLFKRGEVGLDGALLPSAVSQSSVPSLGVDLVWTVQVRPNGNVDDGNLKQAEMTMREVLRLYRNLSVLTQAKGLAIGRTEHNEIIPLHLAAALLGARGVDGMDWGMSK